MRYYKKFCMDVAKGEPRSVELDRILAEAGVTVLAQEKPPHLLAPNETFAIETIQRLHNAYGSLVVIAALQILVASSQPGALRADVIKAMVEIVRAFPNWVADRADLEKVMRNRVKLEALHKRAKEHACKTWVAMLALLTEQLTVALGPGSGTR